jgi:hypothetical protein
MPRGKKLNRGSPETIKEVTEILDAELLKPGSTIRGELVEHAEDYFKALEDLAKGLFISEMVDGERRVYTKEPHFGALKWLLEWYRFLIKEEPNQKRVIHQIDENQMQRLKDFIRGDDLAVPAPVDGVYVLERDDAGD